jgi:formylglycine-generating enzyme required for sulfatase activity
MGLGRILGLCLVLALGLGLGSSEALAEKRVALVIGNGAYAKGALRNPVRDARAVETVLRRQGFETIMVENGKLDAMRAGVRRFSDRLGKDDVGLLYFAGHGIQVQGRNFMIPVDARLDNEQHISLEAMDVDVVLQQMVGAGSRVNLVILDACRDNPFERSFRSSSGGLAQMTAPQGTMIAYATAPGKVASDGPYRDNGLYTTHLIEAIQEPGLPIEQVFKRVRSAVSRDSNGAQVPWEASSLVGDFYFIERAPAVTPVAAPAPAAAAPPAPAAATGLGAAPAAGAIPAAMRPADALDAAAVAPPLSVFKDCDVCPEMIVLPAGTFQMGSAPGEKGRDSDEGPQRPVTFARPFAVSRYEVTRGEYAQFVDATGRGDKGCWAWAGSEWKNIEDADWRSPPNLSQTIRDPVVCVNWEDARAYAAWLREKSGKTYRLLSEAEWEYAARAGTETRFSWGPDQDAGCQFANGADQTAKTKQPAWTVMNCTDGYFTTSPVGAFRANAFRLHDMHGSVWEWVEDCYHDSYEGAPRDGSPRIMDACAYHVVRGGSWSSNPGDLRSAFRNRVGPDGRSNALGFRVARSLN